MTGSLPPSRADGARVLRVARRRRASLSVAEAALSIAQDDYPALDCQAVLAEIDALAARLQAAHPRRRGADAAAAPAQPLLLPGARFRRQRQRLLRRRATATCTASCKARRGIPITLAVLYIEIAGQIGLHASGVSFPGHFLVKLRMPQGEVVIDPFTGQSMSREALDALLVPYRRREGLPGDFAGAARRSSCRRRRRARSSRACCAT